MALPQSEKLARKRKAKAKRYKCITEVPELHNALNEKRWKQYTVAKQKEKGKNLPKKVIKPQDPNEACPSDSTSEFSIWVTRNPLHSMVSYYSLFV